ncbi:hypothetical protein N0V84_001101 [Fusarium piperis]|uniref:Uncharacterized protein n=1 Tax=Fusarium piperis TaxID=1435070 RepID=A0A9W8WLR8_9HYPO|nr:hypothetical protein N0V84_001101 [Fusarium piperis]
MSMHSKKEDEDGSNWEPHFNTLVSVASDLKPSEFNFYPPDPSSPDFDFLRGMKMAQRFLLANLLWVDVLAPISTGASPKLPYREWLDAGKIDMSRVMGCQNSIMIAIRDLVTVDAKAGSMSTETLQETILELEKQIFDGMEAALETESQNKAWQHLIRTK